MAITLTQNLKQEYLDLIAAARIRPEHSSEIDGILARIFKDGNWQRYQTVSAATGIPAQVIAIIHSLEASGNFDCHLHNGDPLTAKTVHVPRNRPRTGTPPFSWTDSAKDALNDLANWGDWSLEGIAFQLELYNGMGYRTHHPHVKSPYLWSYTTIYTAGKYTADGRWSDTAVSRQCGGMALLLRMIQTGKFSATMPEIPGPDEPPGRPSALEPAPVYGGTMLRQGSAGPTVLQLQQRLQVLGIQEVGMPDSDFGEKTEWAVRLFQARHEDSQGEPLEVDGVVGPKTWNSLFDIETVDPTVITPSGSTLSIAALETARGEIGELEKPRGSNRGPMVDVYLSSIDHSLLGQPWCMAFVYWCIQQAATAKGVANPAPKSASVLRSWELAQNGGGRIVKASEARADPDKVQPGMVFYISTGGRTGHCGFVSEIVDGRLVTIEGNTNNDGSREGYGVFVRARRRIESINLGFIDFG